MLAVIRMCLASSNPLPKNSDDVSLLAFSSLVYKGFFLQGGGGNIEANTCDQSLEDLGAFLKCSKFASPAAGVW